MTTYTEINDVEYPFKINKEMKEYTTTEVSETYSDLKNKKEMLIKLGPKLKKPTIKMIHDEYVKDLEATYNHPQLRDSSIILTDMIEMLVRLNSNKRFPIKLQMTSDQFYAYTFMLSIIDGIDETTAIFLSKKAIGKA